MSRTWNPPPSSLHGGENVLITAISDIEKFALAATFVASGNFRCVGQPLTTRPGSERPGRMAIIALIYNWQKQRQTRAARRGGLLTADFYNSRSGTFVSGGPKRILSTFALQPIFFTQIGYIGSRNISEGPTCLEHPFTSIEATSSQNSQAYTYRYSMHAPASLRSKLTHAAILTWFALGSTSAKPAWFPATLPKSNAKLELEFPYPFEVVLRTWENGPKDPQFLRFDFLIPFYFSTIA
jgi:hypothetical protein